MKKLILSFALIAITTLGATAQVSFGIQVGGNLANVKSEYTYSGTTTKEKTKSKFGVLGGLVAEIPFSSSLLFRPELNFIQKGAKTNDTQSQGGYTSTNTGDATLNFIEIPLNVVYSMEAGMGKMFFGAGPSIGFGMSGKMKGSSTISGPGIPTQTQAYDNKVKFDGKKEADLPSTDNDSHLKSLDFGANILAGYKMSNGIFFNIGYTLGFSNLDPNPDSKLTTNGLTLKLGYMFGNAGKE